MSSGYASFDYCTAPPEPADLVKVDIAINGDSVDALSFVCHRDAAQSKGRDVAKRLKEVRTYVPIRPTALLHAVIVVALFWLCVSSLCSFRIFQPFCGVKRKPRVG